MDQKLDSIKATFQLSQLLSEAEANGSEGLTDALGFIGVVAGVDRVYLGAWDSAQKLIFTASQWCVQQLEPMPVSPVFLSDVSQLDQYFEQNTGMFSFLREPVLFEHRFVGMLCLESRHHNTFLTADLQGFLAAAVQLLAPFLHKISVPGSLPVASATDSKEEVSAEIPDVSAPTILIVEDNKINQSSISRLFQHLKIDTHLADDGDEAISLCRKWGYDLILMDISMPGKDGFDTTREIITSCPKNQNTPIIAVTANVYDGIEARCLKLGMVEYVAKPLRLDRAREIVEKFLSA